MLDDFRRRRPHGRDAGARGCARRAARPTRSSRTSTAACRRRNGGGRAPLRLRPRATTRSAPRSARPEAAARQAASSGVRRLRKEQTDDRFPLSSTSASARPQLPRGCSTSPTSLADTPVGHAARRRHRPRRLPDLVTTPIRSGSSSSSRALYGSRVLRSARPVDRLAASSTSTSRRRRRVRPGARHPARAGVPSARLERARRVSGTATMTTYGALAARVRQPARSTRGRHRDEPEPGSRSSCRATA